MGAIPLVLRRELRSLGFEKKKHDDLEVGEGLVQVCPLGSYRFETLIQSVRIEEIRLLENDVTLFG